MVKLVEGKYYIYNNHGINQVVRYDGAKVIRAVVTNEELVKMYHPYTMRNQMCAVKHLTPKEE